jgi:hypothetical protein
MEVDCIAGARLRCAAAAHCEAKRKGGQRSRRDISDSTSLAIWRAAAFVPAMSTAPMAGMGVLTPIVGPLPG